MNESELENIENRWLAASSGPWHIQKHNPKEKPAILLTSTRAVERMAAGIDDKLESVDLHDYDDALRHKIVKNKEEWADYLQGHFLEKDAEGDIAGLSDMLYLHTTRIYCMTPATRKQRELDVDKKTFGGRSGALSDQQGQPSLAVIKGDLEDGDLQFILQATSDMGQLLSEVRRARKKEEDLRQVRKELIEKLENALLELKDHEELKQRLRSMATQILEKVT